MEEQAPRLTPQSAASVAPSDLAESPACDFEYKAVAGGIEITKYIGTSARVRIPEKIEGVPVTAIGDKAFGWSDIAEVRMPDGVTSIGELAFAECTDLTGIDMPGGVTSIGQHAFSDCTGLTGIDIPGGVTEISGGAFSGCTGLTSVAIPDGVTQIGFGAFAHCSGLKVVSIPGNITRIGDYAFGGCTGLTATYGGVPYAELNKLRDAVNGGS